MTSSKVPSKFDFGASVRREILGDPHVGDLGSKTDSFNEPLQRWFTESIWADVWGRDGLPRNTRSLIVIAYLVALDRTEELRQHFPAALRNGCTLEEIREVLMHGAAYCGGPKALAALRIANECMAGEIAQLAAPEDKT